MDKVEDAPNLFGKFHIRQLPKTGFCKEVESWKSCLDIFTFGERDQTQLSRQQSESHLG